MSNFLCFAYFILSAAYYVTALQLTNLSFWHDPDGFTLKPTAGDVISVSMITDVNDPRRVDLLLYNIDLKNATAVLLSLDPIRDANIGFHIPWVPSGNFWLEIYLSPITSLLIQSSTFQIYAPNATENMIPPPSMIPSSSGTTLATSVVTALSTPNNQSTNNTPAKSKNQTLVIVGVTLGAVAAILLITIVILFFRHHKTSRSNSMTRSNIETKSSTSPSLVDTESLAALKAARRAEALREERERLDREIASIEGTMRSLTRNH